MEQSLTPQITLIHRSDMTNIVTFKFTDRLGVVHTGEAFHSDLLWAESTRTPFDIDSFNEMQTAVAAFRAREAKKLQKVQEDIAKKEAAQREVEKKRRLIKKLNKQNQCALKLAASNTVESLTPIQPMSPWSMFKNIFLSASRSSHAG